MTPPRDGAVPPSAGRALAGTALLAACWWGLRSPAVQRADVRLGDTLRAAGAPWPRLDRVVVATTDLGSLYAVLSAGAVLAAAGRREPAADVVGAGLAAWAVSQASKTAVHRARPFERDGTRRLVAPPTGSSFPSGHAAVATAWSLAVAPHARRPRPARWLLAAVGGYVAASRVHVGVHYPSDVAGGAGMGLLVAAAWRGRVAAGGRRLVAGAGRAAAAGVGASLAPARACVVNDR